MNGDNVGWERNNDRYYCCCEGLLLRPSYLPRCAAVHTSLSLSLLLLSVVSLSRVFVPEQKFDARKKKKERFKDTPLVPVTP